MQLTPQFFFAQTYLLNIIFLRKHFFDLPLKFMLVVVLSQSINFLLSISPIAGKEMEGRRRDNEKNLCFNLFGNHSFLYLISF